MSNPGLKYYDFYILFVLASELPLSLATVLFNLSALVRCSKEINVKSRAVPYFCLLGREKAQRVSVSHHVIPQVCLWSLERILLSCLTVSEALLINYQV